MNEEFQHAIDALVGFTKPSVLKQASERLSNAYRGGSSSRFDSEAVLLSYLAARMPATWGAVRAALSQLPVSPASWLDLGAGPGTASWAAAELFPESQRFVLIEKSSRAIEIGKKLAADHPLLKTGEWICSSLPTSLPPADAAILSYSLGELANPVGIIEQWGSASIPFLIILEPGTPRGFSVIRKAREQILSLGGFLVAPCPHGERCPLKTDDWCHFGARIQRSRLHRYLKGGALGYEDEKYSYLIASKRPLSLPRRSRILRPPQKQSGHVRLALCTPDGVAEETAIGRSNQELYRKARDASWGDPWEAPPM